ncbi:hypothetical protein ACH5RR_031332 [Cinchona calisaya]|uniref:Disease resistance protein n=1 Tax=Cinchona calisaya TaxID=153742 RepID=A0ABD2YID2_9GENT
MAEPIVSFLLETISTLLIEEAKFLRGVSDEAQQLHSELKMMLVLLRDADEKQHEAAIVKEWVSQSKDLAFEAEDVLETHAFKIASRRRRRGTLQVIRRFASMINECYIRHKVGLEIQSLNTRISNLTRRFQEYGIRAVITENERLNFRQQQLRTTYSYVGDDEDFVGLGDDIQKLVQVLLKEDDQFFGHHEVVSISGMGGSGKSTLARKVYNHPYIKYYFDSFAWVCISQQWQTRDILQGILISFLPNKRGEIEKWRDDELVEQLVRIQKERKCLVVLDDIWSIDAWKCIKVAFPIRKKGNKILLTTRNKDVAINIDPNGFHHEQRLLTDNESWELLQRKALGGRPREEDQDVRSLEDLGKKMIKFCGGLPLAVVVLGGILATKHSSKEWDIVYRHCKSYLGKGESIQQNEGEVQKILALSYNDLPYKLKPCFLYLSGFSEDEYIETERLYHLWISEGMVSIEDRIGEESIMDIADRYLRELAKRYIVHAEVPDRFFSIKTFKSCRLHDLMRDLCLSKAREENFLKVTDYRRGNDIESGNSSSSPSGNSHRIVIYLSEQDAQKYTPLEMEVANKHLRALSFRASRTENCIAKLADSQFNRFKMLRSLKIEGVITPGLTDIHDNNNIPDDVFKLPIGNLIHLRYLSLRSSELVISPSSISNLEHLEALDLKFAKILWTENVPLRMRRLRYLYLFSSDDFSLQIHASNNLEILKGFNTRKVDVQDFCELTNIQEMDATMLEEKGAEEIINHISNLHKLKKAYILTRIAELFSQEKGSTLLRQLFCCSNLQHLLLIGPLGRKLPDYDSNFFRKLLDLRLDSSTVEEDPMQTLEKLPNLERLWFWNHVFEGKEMICHSTGFPQLRLLVLHHLHYVEKWTVEKGAMPNLSHLEIRSCESLGMIPQGLRFIEPLKELVIDKMPVDFGSRIREVDGRKGEDFDKICHIPTVTITGEGEVGFAESFNNFYYSLG